MDEDEISRWQDALEQVINGCPQAAACPYCGHAPLAVEEVPGAGTRVACGKCGKFVQGRFA